MKKKNIIKICILLSLIIGMVLDYVLNVCFIELSVIIIDLLFVKTYEKMTGEIIYEKSSNKSFLILINILLLVLLVTVLHMLYILLS